MWLYEPYKFNLTVKHKIKNKLNTSITYQSIKLPGSAVFSGFRSFLGRVTVTLLGGLGTENNVGTAHHISLFLLSAFMNWESYKTWFTEDNKS